MKRRPDWTYDEVLLALDLYLPERRVLEETDERVVAVSRLLRGLPIHEERQTERFRSPNAVALKLANLRTHDHSKRGVGLDAGGRRTAEIWARYADHPQEVRHLAQAIAAVAETIGPGNEVEEDGALEGRLLFRRHRQRERDTALVMRRRRAFAAEHGRVFCESCKFDPVAYYGDRGLAAIECHHRRPLSDGGERRTRLEDLCLLCAGCHRIVHAGGGCLSIEELCKLVEDRGRRSGRSNLPPPPSR